MTSSRTLAIGLIVASSVIVGCHGTTDDPGASDVPRQPLVYRGDVDVAGPWYTQLSSVRPDGELAVLARCDDPCGPIQGAALSPDGHHLAYTASCFGFCRYRNDGVHVVDLTTGADRRVAGGGPRGVFLGGVSWSPDGTYLAVASDSEQGPDRLTVIASDGTSRRTLLVGVPGRGGIRGPVWSPDGRWIAFSSFPHGEAQGAIFVVPSAGGAPTRIADGAAAVWAPNREIEYVVDGRLHAIVPGEPDRVVASLERCYEGPWSMGEPMDTDLSPDGARMAILAGRTYYEFDPSTGRCTTVLIREKPWYNDRFVMWGVDG
jgi:dipeptidyl aminopeptidase/acylaminoacyl peptidase